MAKKGVSKISGPKNPKIGQPASYIITEWYPATPLSERSGANIKWELFRKRSSGEYTTTNIIKKGLTGIFTFEEKAYGHEFFVEGYLNTPEKKGSTVVFIKPVKGEPKISGLRLLDSNKKEIKEKPKYGQTLYAEVKTQNMFNEKMKLEVWERDTVSDTGHNSKENTLLYEREITVALNGINYEKIVLTELMMKRSQGGNIFEGEHEYYLLVKHNRKATYSTQTVQVLNEKMQVEGVGSNPPPEQTQSPAKVEPSQKQGKKDGKKIDETCGINYRDQVLCVKFGKKNPKYGPVFWGSLKLANYSQWNLLLSNNKITLEEKNIIIGMSENEGNLDSVQSYDSEIVTVGAMQKTVNPEGYGEFPIQMQEFKEEYPERFKKLFENCGWTVKKEIIKNGKKEVIKWRAYYLETTGNELKNKIREGFNKEVYKKKVKCIPIEPLINAAKDPYFQAKQIEDFILRLRNKVLPIKPIGYEYKIKDYLKSKLGKATALDQHINRPAYVKEDFGKALNNFFKENPKVSQNPNDWGSSHKEYEEDIIEYYGKNRRGTQMLMRYNNMKGSIYLK